MNSYALSQWHVSVHCANLFMPDNVTPVHMIRNYILYVIFVTLQIFLTFVTK